MGLIEAGARRGPYRDRPPGDANPRQTVPPRRAACDDRRELCASRHAARADARRADPG